MAEGPALLVIGEWLMILGLAGLVMWRHEKLLYLGFCIPLFLEGYRTYKDYTIVGIFIILLGLYFLYQAIRGYVDRGD